MQKRKSLDDFLKENQHTVFREKLVNYHFFYQVKLSAAKAQCDISIYTSEVDRDGFDVLLDSGKHIKPFQIKTITTTSTAKFWKVKKNLLRPLSQNCIFYQYEKSPEGEGVEGAFVLIEIATTENDISGFRYYYTDYIILRAVEMGLIRYRNSDYHVRVMKDLRHGNRQERVNLKKTCMIEVPGMDNILALADLPTISCQPWKSTFHSYLQDNNIEKSKELITTILWANMTKKNDILVS